MPPNTKWWHTATIYELYPSSFKDSNADGIGDIPGILSQIPYLASLGIEAVWLAACYRSSGIDMGYDVVDYRAIDPQYGTVQDVETLIAELKKHNIRLIMDLVVNHTSNEHDWFKDSRFSKTSKKRDWYIWRKGSKVKHADGSVKLYPPNNWESVFKGSAWEYDKLTDEWYLRCFAKQQPDLNWDNPEVRQAVYGNMRFWLDKGVAGFGMDVVNMLSKPVDFPDAPVRKPKSAFQNANSLFCNGPRIHEFLQEINKEVLSKYKDAMTVGEVICTHDPEIVRNYTNPERKELDMAYTYDLFGLDIGGQGKFSHKDIKLSDFKRLVALWQNELALSKGSWQTLWLESHDTGRSVTRFGNRRPENREKLAKLLAMLVTTLSGTLFIYQGQELGLTNLSPDEPITAYADIETKHTLEDILESRAKEQERAKEEMEMGDIFKEVHLKARDHARAPLPWNDEEHNAGFSKGLWTWTPTNPNNTEHNIQSQQEDRDSVLNFWRKRLAVRRKYPEALVFGDFEPVPSTMDDGGVFAYWRKPLPDVKKVEGKGVEGVRDVLVVLNLSAKERVEFEIPAGPDGGKEYFVLDSTSGKVWVDEVKACAASGEVVKLGAYEGFVFGY